MEGKTEGFIGDLLKEVVYAGLSVLDIGLVTDKLSECLKLDVAEADDGKLGKGVLSANT